MVRQTSVRPLAMEWLRNAWGNIDGFGRHIYDVMQRAKHNISAYDKLPRTSQGDLPRSRKQTSETYLYIVHWKGPLDVKLRQRLKVYNFYAIFSVI